MKQLLGTELKRFWRDWRRNHTHELDVVLVLQSVTYPVNVGSLFRVADAVHLKTMYLCSATPVPPNATISKVGRDKQRIVSWEYQERAEDAINLLRTQGYHICAVEITDQAVPYHTYEYPDKLAFVLGNEDHGISKSVLELCDSAVFVPMYGKGQSLNVHVSAAVVLYHVISSRLN